MSCLCSKCRKLESWFPMDEITFSVNVVSFVSDS